MAISFFRSFFALPLVVLTASGAFAASSPEKIRGEVLPELGRGLEQFSSNSRPEERTLLEKVTFRDAKFQRIIQDCFEIMADSPLLDLLALQEETRADIRKAQQRISELARESITAPESSWNPLTVTQESIRKDTQNLRQKIADLEADFERQKDGVYEAMTANGAPLTREQFERMISAADAVENASLMSWLTAVAMIHSFTMYRKRGCFKRWSMFAATITFIFVVLGTFITRSGLVQSVHAFAEDPVSTYFFLGIMVAAALAFLILLIYRHGALDDADEIESLASKSGSYYLTNLVCIVGAVLVAYLTVSSALPTWMPLGGQAVSAGVYNAVARPATALFGLLMAVCPLLGWRKTEGEAFARNFRVPAILGAMMFAALMVFFVLRLVPDYEGVMAAGGDAAAALAEQGPSWYYFGVAVVSFLAASLLLATSAYLLARGVRGRMKNRGENSLVAVFNLFRHSPAQAGGYLTHLGCAVVLVGLVGSGMFVHEETVSLTNEAGSSAQVAGYSITFTGAEDTFDEQDDRIMTVDLEIARAGSSDDEWLGALSPSVEVSASTQQQTLHASVLSFPSEDLFVAFQGLNADGSLSLSVKINPLISVLWVGGVITVVGIVLAFAPRRATPLLAADARGEVR